MIWSPRKRRAAKAKAALEARLALATSPCQCGRYYMAYDLRAVHPTHWDCAGVLLGETENELIGGQHVSYDFRFFDIAKQSGVRRIRIPPPEPISLNPPVAP